jgi:hypothetical protein
VPGAILFRPGFWAVKGGLWGKGGQGCGQRCKQIQQVTHCMVSGANSCLASSGAVFECTPTSAQLLSLSGSLMSCFALILPYGAFELRNGGLCCPACRKACSVCSDRS